jgi:hypothetical protein
MKIQSCVIASTAAAAMFVSAGSALAFVPWSNPNGVGTNFSWANGGSRDGLFGSPTLISGNTFVFFPSGFRAQSVNGTASHVSDRLEFDLFAAPGFRISGLRISEFGDYGIIGQGGQVSDGGSMFMTNLDTAETVSDNILTTPGSPITTEGFGTWTGEAEIDVSNRQPPWTRIHFVLDNELVAISAPGGIAFIEKKVFGAGIAITIVPTPGSATLLAAGSLLALRRRR